MKTHEMIEALKTADPGGYCGVVVKFRGVEYKTIEVRHMVASELRPVEIRIWTKER